ncbi:wHTH domain-containing protein [Herbiconiux daphne]|uniref:Rhodanese domain-containing protein n=1 Tax=Herbiconiux daphne TaxID=2970914 RepID=A0ABT2H1Q8_9MICO|nr:hypothetical protein [Herbiconiux daphne]MCS5733841.1 hypothetical protein [Herbiconiux daphne]
MHRDDARMSPPGRPVGDPLTFHLSDRVLALLMGTSLYGDSRFAFRELHQNAVDACRHHDARAEYLRRSGQDLPSGAAREPGAPRIVVREFEDTSGSRVLECRDTGVGMGYLQLASAFCQAGVRGRELEEDADEREAFAQLDEPIEFWTNSRFGIGAFSYFMVADAVSVTTTRLNRDGSLGRRLSFDVTGPHTPGLVVDHGPGEAAGTTVRLALKDGHASPIAVLRDLVAVSPYDVEAFDDRGRQHRWEAGVLNRESGAVEPDAQIVADPAGKVWWCSGRGAVLPDGIWSGAMTLGIIVNLTGDDAPPMTADRTTMIDTDFAQVDVLALAAVGSAVQEGAAIVGRADWLDRTFAWNHEIVDAIIREASGPPSPFPIVLDPETRTVDATIAGYVPGDGEGVPPDAWSFTRLIAGGAYPELGIDGSEWNSFVAGLPTDAVLLGRPGSTMAGETTTPVAPWRGDALSLYAAENSLRRPTATILERARTLGLPIDAELDNLPESTEFVRRVVTDAAAHQAASDRVIGAFAVVRASGDLGITLADARDQLRDRALTYDPCLDGLVDEPPTGGELRLASVRGDGVAPWRTTKELSIATVAAIAANAGVSSSQAIRALQRLGFGPIRGLLDGTRWLSRDFDAVDVLLASRDLDGSMPFLPSVEVSRDHIRRGAHNAHISESAARSRLEALGYHQVDGVAAAESGYEQLELVDDEGNPLDLVNPLPIAHAAILARRLKRPLTAVVARLEELGYRIAPYDVVPGPQHLIAASREADGELPCHPVHLGVPPIAVHFAAFSSDENPPTVVGMLRSQGYQVASGDILPRLEDRHRAMLYWLADSDITGGDAPVPPITVLQLALRVNLSLDRCLTTLTELGLTGADPRRHLPVDRPGDDAAWRGLY